MNIKSAGRMDDAQVIEISVRNLVEFVLRSGDIDDRTGHKDQLSAMQAGSRIHRKIQKSQLSSYHAEVPLSLDIDMEKYTLRLSGRADGIVYEDDFSDDISAHREISPVMIDEIKGVYRDLDEMTEPEPLHLAQAKCYAFMWIAEYPVYYQKSEQSDEESFKKSAEDFSENSVEDSSENFDVDSYANSSDKKISVQITYCNLDTEDIRRFSYTYPVDEITGWFEDVISSYKRWSDFVYEWNITRTDSVRSLEFPYEYRPGQYQLAGDVYRTIYKKKELFIEAPTGSGKTITTLFPTIKAMGEGLVSRIFYLTGKTVTRTVAYNTFELFRDKGLRMKSVFITARDKICPLEERICNPDSCPAAKGHFDRINDALYELLTTQDIFDRDTIARFAAEKNVCPFELSLDLASFCDSIICDVNYVFDPNVSLKRFFAEGTHEDYVYLIDEAHNLVDRGRDMYSAQLRKEDFLHIKKLFKVYNGGVPKALDRCNRAMLDLKKASGSDDLNDENTSGYRKADTGDRDYYIPESTDKLAVALTNLAARMDKFFDKHIELKGQDEIVQLYFDVRFFLLMLETADSHYVTYCDFDRDGDFYVHLYCVDPSVRLQERLNQARSAVFFSATLMPVRYYKKLLTTEEETYAVYADSVFPLENRLIMIGTGVTTLYRQRGPQMYEKYASYIKKITSCRQGNYMVFFPSYKLMEEIREAFVEKYLEDKPENPFEEVNACDMPEQNEAGQEHSTVEIISQDKNMTEADRDGFLKKFEYDSNRTLIAFCVLGGLFSEGIDLTGDRLIGVIIAGAGLPQVCNERQIISDYFDFNYSYLYPGMNRVMQAAGRVIRTADDVGVIALLDDRFTRASYKNTFPREWADARIVTEDSAGQVVQAFWNQHENNEKKQENAAD